MNMHELLENKEEEDSSVNFFMDDDMFMKQQPVTCFF